MGMGRREVERQGLLWVATGDSAQGPRHVFYEKLNSLLAEPALDDETPTRVRTESLLREVCLASVR